MTFRCRLICSLAAALLGAPALANDSSAELAAGGLVLKQDQSIEMKSEDLVISMEEIRVRYVFHNTAPEDVTTLVAFPMPDISTESESDAAVPTDDPENLLGFSTKVDGEVVKARVEQKALFKGLDRTAYLKALGVPLTPHLDPARAALDRLPRAKQDAIVRLGLADVMEYDAGKGMERHLEPCWTLKTTYYWQQNFPAGRDLVVEHRYLPSVGNTAGTMIGSPVFEGAERRRIIAKYCIDENFLAAATKVAKASPGSGAPFLEQRIDYILKTGGNWKKPIGDFRLTIDKGRPGNLLSFCATGVKKVGPTRFEVRKSNWRPDRDLSILILTRWDPAS